ncbi:sensor domain-containing diguanylate cyclase [Motilimonas pumila]|uniref:sensor domain-containing diguanylate cyclase n=1 Tax=Motilimonas pumila TaxID=2303987 RepID=UPI001314FBD7|nr:sensor domain-containing diguanylate cyclase [Motilimonas pumila]
MLFVSHLLLVLVIILGLSWARYHSEWSSRVAHAAALANLAMNDVVGDISTAVSGNSYATMLMPSAVDKFNNINSLRFFDVSGYSDYSTKPYGLRYFREQSLADNEARSGKVWQTQVTEAVLMDALAKVDRLKAVKQHSNAKKVDFLLNKAEQNYLSLINSFELSLNFKLPWKQPEIALDGYFLDSKTRSLHTRLPLRNKNGGAVWAVFDASELYSLRAEVLQSIYGEAFVALMLSSLIIIISTRWIVLPLKRLTQHMAQDINEIELEAIAELKREDEIGVLARDFSALITRSKLQLQLLKQQSEVDPLTGLGSRLKYSQSVEAFIKTSRQQPDYFGLIICDVDHFKAYNDIYGHGQGDIVLTSVAQAIRQPLRETDGAFRIGGEEFVILVRVAAATDVQRLAERVRRAMLEQQIPHKGNQQHQFVTLSVGALAVDLRQFSKRIAFSQLFEMADKALYQAKNNGRNQVIFSQYNSYKETS